VSRSYRVGSGFVGEDSSPGSVHLFPRRKIPLSPLSSDFMRRLRADREDAGVHSRKWKWAYFAQSWCNLSPLDATLLSPLLCVANKELVQCLSLLDATLTKNIGGWGQRFFDVRTFSRFKVFPKYPFSFHILAHSFALVKSSTPLFSADSALFGKNHPGWGYYQSLLPYLVTSLLPLILSGGAQLGVN